MEESSAVTAGAKPTSDFPSAEAKRAKWKPRFRILKRLLRGALLVYLGTLIVLYALQNYLIFPGRSSQGQPRAVIRESTAYQLVPLTTKGGDKTVALFGPALDHDGRIRFDADKQPTVLFFYGNAMCLADTFSQFKQFRELGVNVMIPEFVGYGLAGGSASETTLYETADAAYDSLLKRSDVDPHKIIPAGWSLGAAVAIDLAHRRPCIGLMTFSAFTSMPDMARNMLPWVPASLLLRHHFANESKIGDIDQPMFIAHGRHDSLVPADMQRRLVSGAKKSSLITPVELNSGHNDIFETGDELFAPLGQWIDEVRNRSGN